MNSRDHSDPQYLLASVCPVGIFLSDPYGKYTYVNERWCEIAGVDRKIALGTGWAQALHPADRERVVAEWNHAITGRMAFSSEYRFQRPDGTTTWVLGQSVQERGAGGNVTGYVGTITDVTRIKNAEAETRASRERFEFVAKATNDALWDWNLLTNEMWWNDCFGALFGYAREESKPEYSWWLDRIPDGDRDRVVAEVKKVIKTGGRAWSSEHCVSRADGTCARVLNRSYIVRDDSGKPVRMIGAVTDISDRRRAEDDLRKLSSALEQTADNVFITDTDGRIEYVNRAFEGLTGYSKEEVIGKTPAILKSGKHTSIFYETMWSALLAGEVYRGVLINRKKSGELYFEQKTLTPLKDDRGRITHFVSTGKDITERIRAEETLRESEARLSKAQRLAGVGSFEWCLETNELSWSDELNRIYGLNPQEASPSFELFMSVVHPEDRQTIKEAIDESLRERKPFNLDHRIIRPDGTLRILHCEAEVTGDELNNPLRMVGVCQDITERKRLEDELGQARRMEAVGRLAGGIAHDFNNLLTGILGYTELVLRRLKPVDPLRKEVEEIQKAGNRAAALTSQLLAYSRRQVLQPKILDLNTVIRDMQKMLCRMIGEDISFAANLATDLGYVKADPGQIGQVLMNLSVNARDAMPHGGELSIETANIDLAEPDETMDLDLLPGRYVTVRFTDTGTGIESDVLPYIFEPFFTTKEKDKGTGLGLSTVYGIIKQSGGDVIVESQAGLGTTFTIYLPRAVEEGTAEYRSRIADTQPLADETILLVEDDKLVRDLALNILDDLGYNVLSATDGKDALRVNEENSGVKIDLLLTDMVMPQMNGHELYQALAQSRPAIKVLFMSGYMDEDIMAKTALVEGSAFIQKPFSLDDLARKIRETLGT